MRKTGIHNFATNAERTRKDEETLLDGPLDPDSEANLRRTDQRSIAR
jgi:hypothetical protein